MQMSRRDLAAVGALVFGAANLSHSSAALAEAGDEAAVNQAVEGLRKALLAAEKGQLQQLVADQVSYGHSDGRVQTKAEFIDGVMTRKAVVNRNSPLRLRGFAQKGHYAGEVPNPAPRGYRERLWSLQLALLSMTPQSAFPALFAEAGIAPIR